MHTMFKKVISLAISIIMVLSLVPSTWAEDITTNNNKYSYEVLNDGTVKITGYDDPSCISNVVIPSTISNRKVTVIGSYAFKEIGYLFNVKIPNTVTTIEDYAFYNCYSLSSVSIPKSTKYIGYGAFMRCYGLKDIDFAFGVETIDERAFAYCSSLETVIFPRTLKSLGESAFRYCVNLKNVTLSSNMKEVSDYTFSHCYSLEKVIIPEGVEVLGDFLFNYSGNLNGIVLPSTIKSIGQNTFYVYEGDCNVYVDFDYKSSIKYTGSGNWFYKKGSKNWSKLSNSRVYRMPDDVSFDAWYRDPVAYVIAGKLMNGVEENTFAPNEGMTRAMLVTVLWRLAGSPNVHMRSPFTDLSESWYRTAVEWASSYQIVKGVTETTFAPDQKVDRETTATILYRYAKYQMYDTTYNEDILWYSDASQVSSWANDAMKWAYGMDIISGITSSSDSAMLAPKKNATRAEIATILMRFCKAYGIG